jgi:hypothetical protein
MFFGIIIVFSKTTSNGVEIPVMIGKNTQGLTYTFRSTSTLSQAGETTIDINGIFKQKNLKLKFSY